MLPPCPTVNHRRWMGRRHRRRRAGWSRAPACSSGRSDRCPSSVRACAPPHASPFCGRNPGQHTTRSARSGRPPQASGAGARISIQTRGSWQPATAPHSARPPHAPCRHQSGRSLLRSRAKVVTRDGAPEPRPVTTFKVRPAGPPPHPSRAPLRSLWRPQSGPGPQRRYLRAPARGARPADGRAGPHRMSPPPMDQRLHDDKRPRTRSGHGAAPAPAPAESVEKPTRSGPGTTAPSHALPQVPQANGTHVGASARVRPPRKSGRDTGGAAPSQQDRPQAREGAVPARQQAPGPAPPPAAARAPSVEDTVQNAAQRVLERERRAREVAHEQHASVRGAPRP